MGLFDSLTGKPAKEATALNLARLGALKNEGMGYYNDGRAEALNALNQAGGIYEPLQQKYSTGTNLYLDSLGVNGVNGNERAVSAFQAGPGYEFMKNQALDALDRRAASRGMLASGNNTIDTLNMVTGLANQEYGNWQNRLAGLISPEMAAVGGRAGVAGNIANLWQTDAQNRVNLASNVAGNMNSVQNQGANAQMAASKNMLGLGLNLAQLGAGLPWTSMLGGGNSAPNASFTWGGQQYPMYR
jgi:hypothetical protein